MGEILGLGLSHGPHGAHQDHTMAALVMRLMENPSTPEHLRDPKNWPPEMQAEWGEDQGRTAAHKHRDSLAAGYRRLREALDEFNPDVVLIWGDDQYENFNEDIVPAFCVFAEDEYVAHPWAGRRGSSLKSEDNIWGEGPETEQRIKGAKKIAKELAVNLLENEFDIAYAYKQLHHEMGHAYHRTCSYLDYDRDKGFPYPIIPVHVNCYGSRFTRGRSGEEFDPPGPTPHRCFQLGAAIAQFFKESPYRVALIGSSSWSHAFLTDKNDKMWPDVESDRARYAELSEGNYKAWENIPLSQIEDAGQFELMNWVCLAGAMDHLGHKPVFTEFIESFLFNSSKTVGAFAAV
jgi:hypothetical protein